MVWLFTRWWRSMSDGRRRRHEGELDSQCQIDSSLTDHVELHRAAIFIEVEIHRRFADDSAGAMESFACSVHLVGVSSSRPLSLVRHWIRCRSLPITRV